MNKLELVKEMAARGGMSMRDAYKFINLFQTIVIEQMILKQDLKLQGFGTFTPREQNERLVRNPQTGEPVMFTPRIVAHFKTGRLMISKINKMNEK